MFKAKTKIKPHGDFHHNFKILKRSLHMLLVACIMSKCCNRIVAAIDFAVAIVVVAKVVWSVYPVYQLSFTSNARRKDHSTP